MGLDQRQGELGDLVDELFEAAVFLSPLFDLGDQIHGHVSGVGFSFELPGEIVARVLLALGTAAVGIAASAADGDETSGQDWAMGLEFFLAGLEGAADEGGMFGYFHRYSGAIFPARLTELYKGLPVTSTKEDLATTFFSGGWPPRPGRQTDEARTVPAGKTRRTRKAQRLWAGNHSGAAPGQPETPGLGPEQGGPEGAKSGYVTGLPGSGADSEPLRGATLGLPTLDVAAPSIRAGGERRERTPNLQFAFPPVALRNGLTRPSE